MTERGGLGKMPVGRRPETKGVPPMSEPRAEFVAKVRGMVAAAPEGPFGTHFGSVEALAALVESLVAPVERERDEARADAEKMRDLNLEILRERIVQAESRAAMREALERDEAEVLETADLDGLLKWVRGRVAARSLVARRVAAMGAVVAAAKAWRAIWLDVHAHTETCPHDCPGCDVDDGLSVAVDALAALERSGE